jgi:hypothetical protein
MHVQGDIAAATAGNFVPVRPLKKVLGHSAQNFSFAVRVNDTLSY